MNQGRVCEPVFRLDTIYSERHTECVGWNIAEMLSLKVAFYTFWERMALFGWFSHVMPEREHCSDIKAT